MSSVHTMRKNSINTTPDQADTRAHVLFDRSSGLKKQKTIRYIQIGENRAHKIKLKNVLFPVCSFLSSI